MDHYEPRRPHPAFMAKVDSKRHLELALVVGERIRRLRLDRGMLLWQLAQLVHNPKTRAQYSASHLSRVERGWANAPLYLYLEIAVALEVDPWQLFAADEVRQGISAEERMLLRYLREAGIAPEEALARLAVSR